MLLVTLEVSNVFGEKTNSYSKFRHRENLFCACLYVLCFFCRMLAVLYNLLPVAE